MIDYRVEVWDWQKQDWYLIKAFRNTTTINESERLNQAQALVKSLAKKFPVFQFRLNQLPSLPVTP